MKNRNRFFKIIIGVFIILPVVIIVYGSAVKYLWNWLVPELFKGPTISFYQAIGLILLTKLLIWNKPSKKCCRHNETKWQSFKEKIQYKWACGPRKTINQNEDDHAEN